MAGLVIENLSKRFPAAKGQQAVVALRELNLETHDGELLVIVGPSGSGKSTLLRLIAGLEAPDNGSIRINGSRIDNLPPEQRNVTMVFQNNALYSHMTVRENLACGLRWRGGQRAIIAEKVEVIAGKLGIHPTLDRLPEALSGGEQQRVSLGRSAVLDPDLFLLDEPLAHLDAGLRHQLRQEIRNLNRAAATTLIHVTHDQSEAISLGDRIAVMKDGAIQQIGIPSEIYDAPASVFVAQFFGARPMNLIEGILSITNGKLLLFTSDSKPLFRLTPPPLPSWTGSEKKNVLLGLRPEHFSIIDRNIHLPASDSEYTFEDTIRFREFAGDAQYITTRSGLTIKAAPTANLHEGDAIQVLADTSRSSLFARDSGARIA